MEPVRDHLQGRHDQAGRQRPGSQRRDRRRGDDRQDSAPVRRGADLLPQHHAQAAEVNGLHAWRAEPRERPGESNTRRLTSLGSPSPSAREARVLGAIAGDIIGSPYERHPIKMIDFPLFGEFSRPTDDTVLTVALADSILHGTDYTDNLKA